MRSRFTEQKIIAILREQEAGVPTAEGLSQTRRQLGDALQMEGEVRRAGQSGKRARAKDISSEIAGPADRGKTGHQIRVSRLRRHQRETPPTAVGISKRITALSSRLSDYRTTVPPNACAKAWASPSSSKSTRKTVAAPNSE